MFFAEGEFFKGLFVPRQLQAIGALWYAPLEPAGRSASAAFTRYAQISTVRGGTEAAIVRGQTPLRWNERGGGDRELCWESEGKCSD